MRNQRDITTGETDGLRTINRNDHDGGLFCHTFFPATLSNDDVMEIWDFHNEPAHNGGPGQSFSSAPMLRRTPGRVCVTQFHGLDI